MGFTQSKISNREPVAHCKRCKKFIKQAPDACNLFAAAHSAYTMPLRNTSASVRDFNQGWALGQPLFPINPPIDLLQPPQVPPNLFPPDLHLFNGLPVSITQLGLNSNPNTQEGDQDDERAGCVGELLNRPDEEPATEAESGDETDGNTGIHRADMEAVSLLLMEDMRMKTKMAWRNKL